MMMITRRMKNDIKLKTKKQPKILHKCTQPFNLSCWLGLFSYVHVAREERCTGNFSGGRFFF